MNTASPSFLIGSSSFLQVNRTCIKAWMSLNFGKIPLQTSELASLEHLKNQYNVVSTLAPLFLTESSLFLQVKKITIKSGLSLKFSLLGPCTAEQS